MMKTIIILLPLPAIAIMKAMAGATVVVARTGATNMEAEL